GNARTRSGDQTGLRRRNAPTTNPAQANQSGKAFGPRPISDVVKTNIAAIFIVKNNVIARPKTGNCLAASTLTSPPSSWATALTTVPAAAATNVRITKAMPLTSWRFDWRIAGARFAAAAHIRSATMNQMKQIPARGIRYRPTIVGRAATLLL